jgi:hypothetical protein
MELLHILLRHTANSHTNVQAISRTSRIAPILSTLHYRQYEVPCRQTFHLLDFGRKVNNSLFLTVIGAIFVLYVQTQNLLDLEAVNSFYGRLHKHLFPQLYKQ